MTALVTPDVPSDEYGNPNINSWYAAAYIKSSVGNKWTEETAAWNERLKEIREGEKSTGPSHAFIQIGHSFSPADILSAFGSY